jgi:hypothetical protein
MLPVEPWNAASPRLNTPPSPATTHSPSPDGVAAAPTAGRCRAPRGGNEGAAPNADTPASLRTVQKPSPAGRPTTPTVTATAVTPVVDATQSERRATFE